MRNFQEKSKVRAFFESKPVLFFFGFLVLFFAWNVLVFVGKMQDTAKNRELAEEKLRELEASKEKLSADISRLNTEEGMEESIREKFGLVKEGEDVIVVVDEKPHTDDMPHNDRTGFLGFLKGIFK